MKLCAVCVEPFVDGVLEEDRVDTTAMLMREEHEGCQPMQVHARWSECDKLPPVSGRKRVQRERCCVQGTNKQTNKCYAHPRTSGSC